MLKEIERTYTEAAFEPQPNLCCPPSYDPNYLKIIPTEVVQRDYGCGDPTRYVSAGDTVLDLGSGSGKMCFILAQIVGTEGQVTGVDANTEMLAVARRAAPIVALRLGARNVAFKRAIIEDIDLDLDMLERHLSTCEVKTISDLLELEEQKRRLRLANPPVPDGSVDVVVSNCVLNLVSSESRGSLLSAMLRKLKPGGRLVISDIVCDGELPAERAENAHLHAECVGGAYQLDHLISAFEGAGFVGTRIEEIGATWRTEHGVAFRSATVSGYRPSSFSDAPSSVYAIYTGPWKEVHDETGRIYRRGERVCLCVEEGKNLMQPAYAGDVRVWIGAKADHGAGAWVQEAEARGSRLSALSSETTDSTTCCVPAELDASVKDGKCC